MDDHGLSAAVVALGPDVLSVYTLLAELLLGLHEVATATGDVADRIRVALRLQVNFLVEQRIDAHIVESVTSERGAMSKTFRDRYLHPMAVEVLRPILSGEDGIWPVLTTMRGPAT